MRAVFESNVFREEVSAMLLACCCCCCSFSSFCLLYPFFFVSFFLFLGEESTRRERVAYTIFRAFLILVLLTFLYCCPLLYVCFCGRPW